ENLLLHDAAFNSIANLIPAKYYMPTDPYKLNASYMKKSKNQPDENEIKSKKLERARLRELGRNKTVEQIMKESDSKGVINPNLEIFSNNDEQPEKSGESQAPKRAASLEELQAKLQAKIEELRSKRTSSKKNAPKRRTKEEILQDRLLKKRKLEIQKAKLREKKMNNNTDQDRSRSGSNSRSSNDAKSDTRKRVEKLDVSLGNRVKKVTKKDPNTSALLVSEKKKKKMKSNSAWKSAIQKAKGIKVRDNEKLVKKAIKKQEQRKRSSLKKWESRTTAVKEAIKEKQNKRDSNIKARIEAKKTRKPHKKTKSPINKNKNKKSSKKSRPGFEGKSSL
ncbi:hypothetical protein BB560_004834, partial [Smittium megazygosporum]